jgi:hypothetical protein
MNVDLIRQAIVARLEQVEGIGIVHPFQRYAAQKGQLKDLYTMDMGNGVRELRGGNVRRKRFVVTDETTTYTRVETTWGIELLRGLSDEDQSELDFDRLLDQARAQFRDDEDLGGVVETTTVNDRVGLQLDDSGPASFAGVLVHSARLTLMTQHVEEYQQPGVAFRSAGTSVSVAGATISGFVDMEGA